MRKSYSKAACNGKTFPQTGMPANAITAQAVQEPPLQLLLDREELVAALQEALNALATEFGLVVVRCLLEDEVQRRCGPRYERQPERSVTRHGHQRGVVVLGGQKLPIQRPRMRYTREPREAELETYALLQSPQAMPRAVLQRLLCGVSCRDYAGVVELACEGFGVGKSSVSRHFLRASAEAVRQLDQRRLEGLRVPVIYIDSVEYAGEVLTVALGVLESGQKLVLGLRQGATENAAVCTALLEDLQARGLDVSQPVLLVLDGSKALHAAVRRVWGEEVLIQRCQVHKQRNVRAHLPEKHWPELRRRLSAAYKERDYAAAVKRLQATACWLERLNPDAAASLREGLEETLTVVRLRALGVGELLCRTLATTNPIESAFSVAAHLTRRVKRWRGGDMRRRWCATGLLRAESKFRRVKGYRQMPQLLKALKRLMLERTASAHCPTAVLDRRRKIA